MGEVMADINTWWEGLPGERFWLGVSGTDGGQEVLAVPCATRAGARSGSGPLIRHVRGGDLVFHYDEARRAIVSWSVSRGRVHRRDMVWFRRTESMDPVNAGLRPQPSWVVGLEKPSTLETIVHLDEIARIQWDLFPALRAFEDEVGDPLYYPFAMGSPTDTRLLAGHVFKLPALFIGHFPPLALVADHIKWAAAAPTRAADRVAIRSAPIPASPDTRSHGGDVNLVTG
jgi:hypothetical protein